MDKNCNLIIEQNISNMATPKLHGHINVSNGASLGTHLIIRMTWTFNRKFLAILKKVSIAPAILNGQIQKELML